MVVPDAEATKETYPAEYDLYQRLGIRSVIAVSLELRPVALLAVRNPKRYIQQTSMLRILAYVLLASYNEQKMLNRLQMAYSGCNQRGECFSERHSCRDDRSTGKEAHGVGNSV